jgi:glyoxylase-like metal-dependent hydrolase (beta-lactamase superfamily II)
MLQVGDAEVIRVEEVVLDEPTSLYAGWSDEVLAEHGSWLMPSFINPASGAFNANIHGYVVKTGKQVILIDTCGGNDKERPASPRFHHLNIPWLERLAQAGVTPEKVDAVICTHLHVDHVGWNTRLVGGRWVPTFPNARYIFPRVEVEWRDPKRGAAGKPPATHHVFNDSVLPILEAGMAEQVETDARFSDEIDFMPTPGHAPGQMAVRLRSAGQELLFIADVMHQPIQLYYPHWSSKFCEDPVTANVTRRKVLDYLADRQIPFLPAHFGRPYGGYVARSGDGYAFRPLPTSP